MEAVNIHQYDEQVVFRLVNLYMETGRADQAIEVLDEAIKYHPENYRFHWSKGLIFFRNNDYDQAITCFKKALEEEEGEAMIHYHLGVIYYNQGIELQEASLKIRNKEAYREMRELALEKFRESVTWLEKASVLDPGDEKTKSLLNQLYYQLDTGRKNSGQ